MRHSWEIHWKDYYKILQVHPTASQEIIRAAYQRLARQYHPDSNQETSSAARMAEINEAYDVLGNIDIRRLYHPVWLQKRHESENHADAFKTSASYGNTYRQESETRSEPRHETSETSPQNRETGKPVGYRELTQSKVAILSAAGIILGLDIIYLVLAAILSNTSQSDFSAIPSLVIDVFLVVFLLRGKNWARIWILVRLVIGILFFGGMSIADADYVGTALYVGIAVTLFILLTGSSTRRRIILGLSILIITIIGSVSWGISLVVPSEVSNYRTVSVDALTLELPSNWQNSTNQYDDEYISSVDTEYSIYDAYADKTGNVGIELIVMNMDALFDLYGENWEGWEQFELITGISQETFIDSWMDEAMTEFTNPILVLSDHPTIRSQKYCEYIYTCKIEGIDCNTNFWWIIGQDDLAVVVLTCSSEHWPTFEESWDYIKYSALLN